jgi:coiled-coil domain-containing protein 6
MSSSTDLEVALNSEHNIIETLQNALKSEVKRREDAENNLEDQKRVVSELQTQIDKVRKDKERMAMELEREEEFLTNTLQKKLTAARNDKVAVEGEVGKLKAQLAKMLLEREITARRVEEEEEYITNTLNKKLEIVLQQKQALEMTLSRDESRGSTRSNSVFELDSSGIDSPAGTGSNSSSRRNSGRLSVSRSNSTKQVYKFL